MVTRGSQESSWTNESVVTRRCRAGKLNYWVRFGFVMGKGGLRAIYSIAWVGTKNKGLSLIYWKVQRPPARLLPALLPGVRSKVTQLNNSELAFSSGPQRGRRGCTA